MRGAKIGLEVHVQLNTASKLFCRCNTRALQPNTQTCEICLGMPGSKPVLNQRALDFGLKLAMALNCKIAQDSFFSRKVYFYPDLSKNYQITQYEKPIADTGYLKIRGKLIRIRRVHLEEDPASLKHPSGIAESDYVLADYNRSGIPLCEIVTDPDIESAEEARLFLEELFAILDYLNVFNSLENVMKVDTNVSIPGHPRVEVKNIGSIRDVERAINYEIVRQEAAKLAGHKLKRETRRYSAGGTEPLREKETEEEYGYIFDPDLPQLVISKTYTNRLLKSMPELPQQKLERFKKQYTIPENFAFALILEQTLADCFERVAKKVDPKFAADWMATYLRKILNYNKLSFARTKITSEQLAGLFKLILSEKVTPRGGELLLRKLVLNPQPSVALAKKMKLLIVSDEEIRKAVQQVLKKETKAVRDYKSGKVEALQFLVGRVLNSVGNRAHAKRVLYYLKRKL